MLLFVIDHDKEVYCKHCKEISVFSESKKIWKHIPEVLR